MFVVKKDGWGNTFKVTVSAYEKSSCTGSGETLAVAGQQVDSAENVFEFPSEDVKDVSALTLTTVDSDDDGFVSISAEKKGTDCADNDPMRNPGQKELCDDKDNNCVGPAVGPEADEGLPKVPMFLDGDKDGVGREATTHCVPEAGVTGYATVGGDCKDDDADIAPGKTDICDNKDNNCDGATDENDDKKWYQDGDQDGSLGEATIKTQCGQPDNSYRHRVQNEDFDCNDADGNNTPGKTESCDNADNNCDGNADEAFPTKGTSCNLPSVSCAGTWVCTGDKLAVECNARAPRLFYPDRDGDGDGDQNATVDEVCANETPQVGHVENLHGDCDDVDPAARSGLAEVCDAIDNNCNAGVSDEPLSCGGTLKDVASYHLTSDSQDWKTVAVGQGGYPVWVAGRAGKLAVRKAANQKFESYSYGDTANPSPPDGSPPLNTNNCGDKNWTVSWVDSQGSVFLGGEAGWVAKHAGTSAACGPGTLPPPSSGPTPNITGMVGFESGGATTIYVSDTNGRLFRWAVGAAGNPFLELNDNINNLYGLHALREDFMLAVGHSSGGGDRQRFLSYAVTTGTTPAATPTGHTSNPTNVDGKAIAVWMGDADKACAVGDDGAAWRWNGATTWDKTDAPSEFDFTSVVMRYDTLNPQNPLNEQCYMVDKRTGGTGGKLHRLTPYGWAKGPDLTGSLANVPLNDIAITEAGHLWIVGEDGRVFHYPEP
ncbi:putative metal-binding motif-containing protein [Myxococcus llanfairpwllgwyngyllgogerychwyrndrobwllllantysiliogogogochensis]|uniref:putative metal-binding motif-containing protein n=1 Tax=Myxococcus llanfairpwllgwyngyllgogerychwyrndrobwllllantysiliogogogochensis TaxID=2590453 RepID=UPI001FEC9B08|nr:putative metal-binding motif-containing protein [Myxococcus llanfairpwllgwyngyllgogerychwyrndrobwllllantysiliogogogochensis]